MNRPIVMKTLSILIFGLMAGIATAEIHESSANVTPLDIGARIPDVSVVDAHGNTQGLRTLVGMQPSIIIFYRGSWCPYCNRHLAALAEIEGQLKATGFQILAISPDKPAGLKEATEKNNLGYQLFSDSAAKATEAFGLGFRVDEKTRERYKGYNIDLEAASGHDHYVLPVPAVYLVGSDGHIKYRYYNPDYKVRLSPEEILNAATANAPKPVE